MAKVFARLSKRYVHSGWRETFCNWLFIYFCFVFHYLLLLLLSTIFSLLHEVWRFDCKWMWFCFDVDEFDLEKRNFWPYFSFAHSSPFAARRHLDAFASVRVLLKAVFQLKRVFALPSLQNTHTYTSLSAEINDDDVFYLSFLLLDLFSRRYILLSARIQFNWSCALVFFCTPNKSVRQSRLKKM